MISLYTSSIVAVIWLSVIKRRKFLEILEYISEVDNKIRFTLQEETNMNRKVMFNTISEFFILIVLPCTAIVYLTYETGSGQNYIFFIKATIKYLPDICNELVMFQFCNLVLMMKLRYTHLKKRLTKRINSAISRQICLKKRNESCSQTERAFDQVHIASLYVSSVRNIEGTLRQTDIHLLRQIYSEMYDVTCLINDTYGIPILATMCCMLTGVVFFLYRVLFNFKEWGIANAVFAIIYCVFFFKVTFYCHTATNEARSSRIVVQKLLLEGNCRIECVKQLKMFSLQLQEMTNEYTACGFFTLNLKLFASVVSAIVSYVIIIVQIK